jgi:3-methyladenine DNA glycosylase AlkD
MTVKEVLALLEKNKDKRGIEHWKKYFAAKPDGGCEPWKKYYPVKLDSFGIGLTKLKSFGKKIGKNHELAAELWKENIYEAKIMSVLIEDPKLVTETQVDRQVNELGGILVHVFTTVLMHKLPFLKKKVDEWTKSKDNTIRRCGYSSLYVLAKTEDKIEDKYFESYLAIIEKNLQKEENMVKDAMNNSVLTIGMRNKSLNAKAIAVAKKVGKVDVYYGDNSCEAVDCIKHLTGERIQKSLKTK